MAKTNKPYTVVGYYEDSSQIFNAHVTAEDECDAVVKTPKVLTVDAGNVIVVSIFKGHLRDLNETVKTSAASDWASRVTGKAL